MTFPTFSVGEVLRATDMNAVSGWLVSSTTFTTISSGSPLDINNVFTSDYDNYRVMVNWTQNTTGADLQLQFRTSGGVANTNIYGYSWGGNRVAAGPTYTWAAYAQTNPFAPVNNFALGFPGSGQTASVMIDISRPHDTVPTYFTGNTATYFTGTFYNVFLTGGGVVDSTVSYTGLRLFPSAGSATGTIRIYGYRD